MSQTRRDFVRKTSIASLGFFGLGLFIENRVWSNKSYGYGLLETDPNGILKLPRGFSYKIISRHGEKMSDGFFSPGQPDGMATFLADKNKLILIRNHEIDPGSDQGPFGKDHELLKKIDRKKVYDYGNGVTPSTGGTTTLLYNEKSGKVEKSFLSLTGTNRNCAGGMTSWNSWISCEENVDLAGGYMEKDHGFNFEVPATKEIGLTTPFPLKDMGRFNHEAVAVDPATSIVYQTEDRPDGLIYRFIPKVPKKLFKGGKLQVMVIKEQKSFDTRNWKDLQSPKMPVNHFFEVEWQDINNVISPDDDLRYRGNHLGAARFARGEGMWYGKNELYFACTNGGEKGNGQVFRYLPSPYEGTSREKEAPGRIELFLESHNTEILKGCDNLTIAPWGDLILCEDDPHPFVVGITPKGECYKLIESIEIPSEFSGGVFSPSGETFFVNIQRASYTLAITGPWKKKKLVDRIFKN